MNLKELKWGGISVIVSLWMLSGCDDKPVKPVATAPTQAVVPVAIARGKVDVDGGIVTLSFPSEGVVDKVLVTEGQAVQKGQILMQQDHRLYYADKRVAESEIAVAVAQLQGIGEQLPGLKQKATRLKMAAQAGAAQMQLSDEAYEAVQQAKTAVTVAQAQANLAERRLAKLVEHGAQLDLRAPFAGSIVKLNAQEGAFISSGQPVILFLPNKPFIIRAELNESYLAGVKVGMKAKVQIDNDSERKDLPTAHVIRISSTFVLSQLQENAQQSPRRVVECILAFDSEPSTLVGQNVVVSFYDNP
ncbi:TPA: HlyD family efflux transporter periplasmic adaptor subunit [Serratia marcescens]|uniref:HlyD family efflux transporter periplasmic adaptor subunit n=4 Tax=Serratia TaxID=613 RepID=A0AAW6WYC9_9GAMM|nr:MULTISPECIES: HlyD family efflux transporter periplasmic adaptor subunit [Serratia]MBX9284553.1 HlyD family efflux transporter periplasmic adaptor subunit [Serratia marcescens]MBX9289466.1 HlyD family efflux transporter periplasmic adaptor subunit [Serratia marcescens]MBX9294076.1 HlyD family efflux transporter periplasmic adaptor subunit [Serratia marcescens]MBX9303903.1 HlyD family efflux transporter periplasmic adaptor subunit [Serratia marcescens]MBX9305299.1 HlyD family efflux transpor